MRKQWVKTFAIYHHQTQAFPGIWQSKETAYALMNKIKIAWAASIFFVQRARGNKFLTLS